MYFTEEERAKIEKHLPLIELIIKTSSASYISIEAKEDLLGIAVQHGWASCKTCAAGLFNAVARIYHFYVQDMNELREAKSKTKKKKA